MKEKMKEAINEGKYTVTEGLFLQTEDAICLPSVEPTFKNERIEGDITICNHDGSVFKVLKPGESLTVKAVFEEVK